MRVNSRPHGYNGTQSAFADFDGGASEAVVPAANRLDAAVLDPSVAA